MRPELPDVLDWVLDQIDRDDRVGALARRVDTAVEETPEIEDASAADRWLFLRGIACELNMFSLLHHVYAAARQVWREAGLKPYMEGRSRPNSGVD
jgi:hypothetical protein